MEHEEKEIQQEKLEELYNIGKNIKDLTKAMCRVALSLEEINKELKKGIRTVNQT